MLKRLLRSPAAIAALGTLIGAYMAFVDVATRWELRGRAGVEPYWREGRPLLIAVWHGRLMQMHKCWPRRGAKPGHVLISQSREGEVVAAATRFLGYSVIRGSSAKTGKAKGALAATREILKRLEAGETVALTPDGPKGPRMRAGLGPAQIAKLSGAPLVPIAWAIRPARALASWDRFLLPLPFGRGVFIWGAPIPVGRDLDEAGLERARATLEAELNRLTAEADRWAGRAEILPAAPGEPRRGEAAS